MILRVLTFLLLLSFHKQVLTQHHELYAEEILGDKVCFLRGRYTADQTFSL
jgi:hypothetical protein